MLSFRATETVSRVIVGALLVLTYQFYGLAFIAVEMLVMAAYLRGFKSSVQGQAGSGVASLVTKLIINMFGSYVSCEYTAADKFFPASMPETEFLMGQIR